MTNPLKGQVAFEADGKPLTAVLDFNALCSLEPHFPGIMKGEMDLTSPTAIRRVFHTALTRHHPEVDELAAGDIIQSIGLEKAGEVIGQAITASFPEAAKGKADPQ